MFRWKGLGSGPIGDCVINLDGGDETCDTGFKIGIIIDMNDIVAIDLIGGRTRKTSFDIKNVLTPAGFQTFAQNIPASSNVQNPDLTMTDQGSGIIDHTA